MSDMAPITVRVNVASPYDVVVGAGLLAHVGERVKAAVPAARRAFVVFDDACEAYAQQVKRSLAGAGFEVHAESFASSEENKCNDSTDYLLLQVARAKFDRNDVIIALGGGIVGDIAGFVAATYRRGIAWVQCPTTLLSMVDASVGGKTGVNLRVGDDLQKNMVGAFHQPSLVLADVHTLATLSDAVFADGCAEIIKHAMIARSVPRPDETLTLTSLQALLPTLRHDTAAISQLVARNVAIKAAVVEGDEHERKHDGGRALLNLGHTFGHAMETVETTGVYGLEQSWLSHGEAVALGLIAAARAAAHLKLVSEQYLQSVRATIEAAKLPTRVAGLPPAAEMMQRMYADKKTLGGSLRVILPIGEGTAKVVRDPDPQAVLAGWQEIRA